MSGRLLRRRLLRACEFAISHVHVQRLFFDGKSRPIKWQKAAYGIAIPNFLISGALYSHTAAKLIFVRIFRKSEHLYNHTVLGWSVWIFLVLLMNAAAFVLGSFYS